MQKETIFVNSIEYEFFLDERLNMWRIIENKNIISNYTLDVEIDLQNLSSDFKIVQITSFLEYIQSNNDIIQNNINDAKVVLITLFKTIYKGTFDTDILDNIDFNFVGIDYKGCSLNYQGKFNYDFQFFPFYKEDKYRDIGTFLWKALFRDKLLLGVYSDTQ